MSIDKLKIKNFQIHEELELNLSKNITTIVGDSDRGKSAVLRSIIWNLTNKPKGDNFINWNATSCSVSLEVDGKTVTRSRDKKENKYVLGDIEFKALGSEIPQEVSSLFNVSEKNFQQQHDGIFWFTLSPSQVAEQLNSIVDMEIVDYTFSQLNSMIRSNKSEANVHSQMLGELEDKIEKIGDLGVVEKLIKSLEKKENIYKKTKEEYLEINKILSSYFKNEEEIEKISWETKKLKEIVSKKEKLKEITNKKEELWLLLDKIKTNEKTVSGFLTISIDDLKKIERVNARLLKTIEEANGLKRILESYKKTELDVKSFLKVDYKDLSILEEKIKLKKKAEKDTKELSDIVKRYENNQNTICNFSKLSLEDLKKLEEKIDKKRMIVKKSKDLKDFLKSIDENLQKIEKDTFRLESRKERFKKEMEKGCPLCGKV